MRGYVLRIMVLMLALLAAGNALSAEDKGGCIPVRTVSEKDLAYTADEYLKFTMHFVWGKIDSDVGYGEVRLDTVRFNGTKAFKCNVYGRTSKFFDLFFKVREEFSSCFSCEGLRPLKFTRNTLEGKYKARNSYIYRRDAEPPYIDADVFTTSTGQRNLELPLGECTYDLPALFYLARNMDFDKVEPGVKYPMAFAIDDEVFNVYFILCGREEKKVKGLGTVKTIKFAAKLLAGEVFTGEHDMTIWISDDENRIPVLFEAPLHVGVASGRLADYSGLKHPFSSLIK